MGQRMTVRRLVLVVGVVILGAGVIGLVVPVSASEGSGPSIGCGNALAADLSAARSEPNRHGAGMKLD
jgi:hypothetical protein